MMMAELAYLGFIVAIALYAVVVGLTLWLWPMKPKAEPNGALRRRRMLPEEYMELRAQSLEMHYGDEPLYLLDPPEWPYPEECFNLPVEQPKKLDPQSELGQTDDPFHYPLKEPTKSE